MGEVPPLMLKLLTFSQGLLGGFISDIFRDIKSSDSSVNLEISFSSSDLENPVVRMET